MLFDLFNARFYDSGLDCPAITVSPDGGCGQGVYHAPAPLRKAGGFATLCGSAAAKILPEELGRDITYANPSPAHAKKTWIRVPGLDKEYSTVMGMLYMMMRLGTAKKVTTTFEEVTGKKTQTFRQFATC